MKDGEEQILTVLTRHKAVHNSISNSGAIAWPALPVWSLSGACPLMACKLLSGKDELALQSLPASHQQAADNNCTWPHHIGDMLEYLTKCVSGNIMPSVGV